MSNNSNGKKLRHFLLASLLLVSMETLQHVAARKMTHDVVETMDGAPIALGAGYSVTANSCQASCFDVSEVNAGRTFNFDYYITDLTKEEDIVREFQSGKIAKSFGFDTVISIVNSEKKRRQQQEQQPQENTPPDQYTVVLTMRVDRMPSTLVESSAKLTPEATRMLRNGEYINFFSVCGPNYIRSIERAQEVSVIFTFQANDKYEAQKFARLLKMYAHGNRKSMKNGNPLNNIVGKEEGLSGFDDILDKAGFDTQTITQSLSIQIVGYGIKLNGSGSVSLIATDMNEVKKGMRFAYLSMTTKTHHHDDSNDVEHHEDGGLVSSFEIMSWVENIEFLNFSGVKRYRILAPIPRGMIENPKQVVHNGRAQQVCKSINSVLDDYGKCCKTSEMKNVSVIKNEDNTSIVKRKCEPQDYLSPALMKGYLETNAEFVSWMSAIAKRRMKSMSTLNLCVNKLRSMPKRLDYYYLQQSTENDGLEYDESIEWTYTVKELKAALGLAVDQTILDLITNENDEYFEMFYRPCLSALYYGLEGEGNSRDIDPKYFMARPWYNIDECSKQTCLEHNAAWDRLQGDGCVSSILRRDRSDSPIPAANDPFCAKALDQSTGEMTCKYMSFANFIMQMDYCRESLPPGIDGRGNPTPLSMGHLINYFCMPQVALDEGEADEEKMSDVDAALEICILSNSPSPTGTASFVPTSVSASSLSFPSSAPTGTASIVPTSVSASSLSFPSSAPTGTASIVPSTGNTSSQTAPDTSTHTFLTTSDYHACAIDINDSRVVKCWGSNTNLRLGHEIGGINPPQPVNIGAGRSAISVSCGGDHCCALLDDDSVKCWGEGSYGQIGDGNTSAHDSVPVAVSNLGHPSVYPVSISTGEHHSCALLSDHTLKCWGRDNFGQLGDDTTLEDKGTPALVANLVGDSLYPVALYIGSYHAYTTCAKLNDKSLKCWGKNNYGQVGSGSTAGNVRTPELVDFGPDRYAISVSLSLNACFAVLDDGSVRTWGNNLDGTFGIGSSTPSNSNTPIVVDLGTGNLAESISTSGFHACVILRDKAGVMCWGRNHNGRVGDATTTLRISPVTVTVLDEITSSAYPVAISAGWRSTCIMWNDGRVQCWGNNSSGRLGDGTTTDSYYPVDVLL